MIHLIQSVASRGPSKNLGSQNLELFAKKKLKTLEIIISLLILPLITIYYSLNIIACSVFSLSYFSFFLV